MKQKPKLYIKNEKGRYVEYKEPTPEYDDTYYHRLPNGKYKPFGKCIPHDFLHEGVWVVTKHPSSLSITNATYLRKVFNLDRASDIPNISIAELGGLTKLAHHLAHHWGEIQGNTVYDKAYSIVGILARYKQEKQTEQ